MAGAISRLTLPPHIHIHIPTSIRVCALVLVSAPKYVLSHSRHPAPSASLPPLFSLHLQSYKIERGVPLAGTTPFHGARETTLWFLGSSAAGEAARILANAGPAEFWPLADLAPGDAGVQ